MSILKVRSFVVVTGASRGIGRAIAIQLASKIHPESVMLLTARSLQGLEETAAIIKRDVEENMDARCIAADLSDKEDITKVILALSENVGDVSRFEHAMLVHNAAWLNAVDTFARELCDIDAMQQNWLLNLTSPIAITSGYFKLFEKAEASLRRTIVQISSISATMPIKTLHLYGSGKAARDMFFRVMTLEEPEVRVLTYDPGMVDTEIYRELCTSKDSQTKEVSTEITKQPYFLSPEQTAVALMKALEEDKYENGVTVRAYEVMNVDISQVSELAHPLG